MLIEDGITQAKLIEMYQAREAILNRINPAINSVIDIDKFLQATVTEVGQRLTVDRCNVVTPARGGGFWVSHEYRSDERLSPGVGLNIPDSLIPTESIRDYLPKARPYSIDDVHTASVPPWVRTTCQLIGTRSILVAPFVFRQELLGVMGLHYCNRPHHWTETEVSLVEWLAGQVSIGLQYTRLYTEKEKEVAITKVMLEISNDINTRNDFNEITTFVIDKALELLRADYGCIAILDSAGDHLHFDAIRARRGFDARRAVELRFREARSIRLPDHPVVREVMEEGRTLKLEDPRESSIARYLLANLIKGESALIAPITIKERVFGIIALVWVNEPARFSDYDVQLLNGISSQVAIALEKDRLAAEVIRLKRELNDVRSGERIIGSSPKIRRAIEMALSVADSQTTALIQGESGTGKELIASLIQFNSRRAAGPSSRSTAGRFHRPCLRRNSSGTSAGLSLTPARGGSAASRRPTAGRSF